MRHRQREPTGTTRPDSTRWVRLAVVMASLPALAGAPAPTGLEEEQIAEPAPPEIRLPEGAAARVWAGVGPTTSPATLPDELGELGDDPWQGPACWELWGELVKAERDAERPDMQRRATLCLLAQRQGRTVDAWGHFASLTASPEWAAAVLPYLMPGIPAEAGVEAGGRPAPLPDGVLLRPATPPALDPADPFRPRAAEIFGLRIGEGQVRMLVSFEASGIEVVVEHTSGAPVEVAVVLPEPEGLRMHVEYTDWTREEDLGAPRTLTLGPGDEALSVYGRFVLRDATEPTGRVERVPDPLRLGGLFLDGPAGSREDALLTGAAHSLQELLGFPVTVRDAGEPIASDGPSGVVVRLDGDRRGRLSYLASRVEKLLLGE